MNTGKTPASVHVDSLPWSLRHASPAWALDDARDLAAFLWEATTTPRADGMSIGDVSAGNWHTGLNHCFMLLIDKLDIAAGAYKFPTASHDSNAPHLCEREGSSHE